MFTHLLFFFLIFFSLSTYSKQNDLHQKPLGAEGTKNVQLVSNFISKARFGMDFGLRYQALHHKNDNSLQPISKLSYGFTNANGNANADFELSEGITTYIESYLSSEHHREMWMKEGYLFVDKLEMLNSPRVNEIMNFLSFKAGQMEINYGDYHLRRTDNGKAVRNPFIGNYIIDANTTEIAVESMLDLDHWEALIGVSGGTTKGDTNDNHDYGKYSKLAYDTGLVDNKLFRISGSIYSVNHAGNPKLTTQNYLYSGNRSGSPYAGLFDAKTDAGQVLPNTSQDLMAYVFNILFKYKNTELFLDYDVVQDSDPDGADTPVRDKEAWAQYAVDLKYNFSEKFYSALRYNIADHLKKQNKSSNEYVGRSQLALGYFLTSSISMKIEYAYQKYYRFEDKFKGGSFSGAILEGAVSF